MERIIDKQQELNRIKQEMSMIKAVQRGEKIICPYCNRGHLVAQCNIIKCNDANCSNKYTLAY